jgi:hypothetical protein
MVVSDPKSLEKLLFFVVTRSFIFVRTCINNLILNSARKKSSKH